MYRPGVCVRVRLDSRARNDWANGHIPLFESVAMQQYGGALPESRVLVYVPGHGVRLFHTVDVIRRHNCVKQPRTRRPPSPPAGQAPRMTAEKPVPELVATDSDATYPSADSQSSSPCSRCDAELGADDLEGYLENQRAAGDENRASRKASARELAAGHEEAVGGRTAPGVRKSAGVHKSSGARKSSGKKASGKRRRSHKASGGQSSCHASHERAAFDGQTSRGASGREVGAGGASPHASAGGQASGANPPDLAPTSSDHRDGASV